MSRSVLSLATFAVVVICGVARAADFPRTELKVLGGNSAQNMSRHIFKPYFEKDLPAKTGGRITATFNNFDLLNLKGEEVLRLTELGVFDISNSAFAFMAGRDAMFEGIDLPGITLDIQQARKAADAYRPLIEKRLAERFKSKLLAITPIALQVLYCREPINSLSDLKGKKIRVFSRAMSDYMQAVGATSVNIPYAEVVPAMNQGVADCAATGTSAGNTARWWEVTRHMYMVPLGWAMQYVAANTNNWNKLDPGVREFLGKEFAVLEERMWALGASDVEDGVNCNTGKGVCKDGIPAKPPMTVIPLSQSDRALHLKLVADTVVSKWGERCGKACLDDWNRSIGAAIGMSAK